MDNTPDEKLDRKGQLVRNAENRRYWGIATTGKSRERMMAILLNRAIHEKDKFVCSEIIDEMNTLVRNSRGTIAAANGKHDDAVMSYLIGMYTIKHGVNLRRYGIIQGLKYTEEDEKPIFNEEEDDPVKMWEALPDSYKKIFPKPGQTIMSSVNAEVGSDVTEEVQNFRDQHPDPIYNQIRNMQKRRALKRAILNDEDIASIDVESDDEYIKEMVKMAESSVRRSGGAKEWAFDLADMMNK
jgi:hypothetical protein